MNGHRSGINTNKFPAIYQHFNQADHSILSMKVRILEKVYHPSNHPGLSTPERRRKEEYWIRELGTAMPYGCNDKIDSIGNLSSPKCSDVNVMRIFNESTRRKRGHGHRHYTSPQKHDDFAGQVYSPFFKNLSDYTILDPNYILYLCLETPLSSEIQP